MQRTHAHPKFFDITKPPHTMAAEQQKRRQIMIRMMKNALLVFYSASLLLGTGASIGVVHAWKPQHSLERCCTISTTAAFAGGGFGSSSASKKRTSNKKKNKKRGGGGGSGFASIESVSSPPPPKQEEPLLDKWGLPVVPTEEELFPPMPPGTELIGVDSDEKITLQDIQNAMKNYVELNLDLFDENCVEKKNPSPDRKPMKLRLLHKSPPVLAIDNFFTEEECDETRAIVDNKEDATSTMQVDSATFSPLATSKRTSTTWFCHFHQMSVLLSKAMYLLDISLNQTEEPQIVRYKTGQEFSWHYDEVPPPQLHNGGQRVATLLVYLNTVTHGGGTVFRDLYYQNEKQLTMKPRKGSALLFFPSDKHGKPDDRTLHKGQVAGDTKWIAQMWVHEYPYKPVVPEGNSHEAAMTTIQQAQEELGYYSTK